MEKIIKLIEKTEDYINEQNSKLCKLLKVEFKFPDCNCIFYKKGIHCFLNYAQIVYSIAKENIKNYKESFEVKK